MENYELTSYSISVHQNKAYDYVATHGETSAKNLAYALNMESYLYDNSQITAKGPATNETRDALLDLLNETYPAGFWFVHDTLPCVELSWGELDLVREYDNGDCDVPNVATTEPTIFINDEGDLDFS